MPDAADDSSNGLPALAFARALDLGLRIGGGDGPAGGGEGARGWREGEDGVAAPMDVQAGAVVSEPGKVPVALVEVTG